MKLFMDLFSSDVGLFSAATIGIVLAMGAFYVRYFIGHMHADEARAAAAQKS
ncbi:DUF3149 domain-containing protein [Roseateles sp.]|uniref:DUF3149 domain-containing protein n=1 Tax=Roseateles sp. TaxID=1971397 RepID=UPI003BA45280